MIRMVNGRVNSRVEYKTDIELYKMPEFWSWTAVAGDCEDYALAKARMLMEQGFPVENLRLATCFTEPLEPKNEKSREYHAILVATVEDGDWLLDNRFHYITRLSDTDYIMHKIQVAGKNEWEFCEERGSA
jgi:predicted transglutaminase-like cysteine proteinase